MEVTTRDIETGEIDLEILPESSPSLVFSHSCPSPSTMRTAKKLSPIEDKREIGDDRDPLRQRANSDPLKSKTNKNEKKFIPNDFIPLPPQLKQTISSRMNAVTTSVKLFYCHICFENHAERDAIILQSCDRQHRFCKECIQSLLRIQVNDGQIDFACPLFGECPLSLCLFHLHCVGLTLWY